MNEMLQVILDTTNKIFLDRCTRDVMAKAEQGAWPAALWRDIVEAGISSSLLCETRGGAGLSLADGLAVVRLTGYHTVPLPLAETMFTAQLLTEASQPLPEGALVLAPATHGSKIHAERVAGGWSLNGLCRRVPWGGQAARVLAQVSVNGHDALACFDPFEAKVVRGANLAFEPRDDIHLQSLMISGDSLIESPPQNIATLGALLRSQQLAGAMQRVLDMSVSYAGERIQFGRPIAKFQAIQQQLAIMAGHVAASNAAAEAAADGWQDSRSEFFVAIAKSRAGEAAGQVAAIAHQVHGAMGFTREHPLHYATRRLWSWRDEFGNESYWQRRLGQQVLKLGADGLWPFLVQPSQMMPQEDDQ